MDERFPAGWLFLDPSAVPERWSGRGRPVVLVALDDVEAASILRMGSTEKATDDREDELLHLVASGLSAQAIAKHMDISVRTIHRQLAELRFRFAVMTTAELAAELARRGF